MFIILIKLVCGVILCALIWYFIVVGIDVLRRLIIYLTIVKFNYYSTKIQKKVIQRKEVPYIHSSKPIGEIVDISSLLNTTPKLVTKINVMTGDIQTKNVWKNRGISGKILYPWNQGMKKTVEMSPKTAIVKKVFIYSDSMINTLNLNYPNWQELNPKLIKLLQTGPIVAEEVLEECLQHFQK